jgi:capsular polysaccharide biosynthesis protein
VSQQPLDLRRSVHIVRRHKVLVGVVAVLGVALGTGYAVLTPPTLTSTALVALVRAVPSMTTEVYIATSDSVLSQAQHSITPATSIDALRGEVQVKSLTSYILSVSAKGKTPAQAQATANAVANSFIAYVGAKSTTIGHVPAEVFQPAAPGTGTSPLKKQIIFGILGLLFGVLIGAIVALAVGRNDRRLRERDQIANSIGVPVLASVPVGHPSDPAGWTKLLEDYEPGVVEAWRLRKALQQLGMAGDNLHNGALRNGYDSGSSSLTVLSLSSDPGAQALGPQLAVFTASSGIPTALIIGPQQDENVTATLRTACTMQPPASSKRPHHLQIAVSDGGDRGWELGVVFTVVVAVVDGENPQMPQTMRTTATVLGVSSGAATAEQLARVAVSADADGREIAGILVADPESADPTTGRIPQLARTTRRRMPARGVGLTTEMRK